MKIKTYIVDNHKTIKEFCEVYGLGRVSVSQWIRKGYIIIGNTIYSPRKTLDVNLKNDPLNRRGE